MVDRLRRPLAHIPEVMDMGIGKGKVGEEKDE